MSASTISTFQLFKLIPDQEAARLYLEARLWHGGPRCPVCGLGERITARKGGYYRCNQCKEDFTVRTGTIFERSHVPLHKWVYAMYLLVTARKGISSLQLAKEIGITQKSAWFVLHRLREACGVDPMKDICSDCPPVGYSTDKTRCAPCPRRRIDALDGIVDKVLAYRPKPKSAPAKSRKRRKAKFAKKAS